MNSQPHRLWQPIFGYVGVLALALVPASANTFCVNPGGSGGCFASINAAVQGAAAGDTINVGAGTYSEDVLIDRSISIVGASRDTTVINAAGKANGFFVDGLDHAGLSNVNIANFTVHNANFEGILIANASVVTVIDNNVRNNNLSLTASGCPGLPSFETNEGMDCGEGIHLLGAAYSTIANNISENNSGGILVSDDTAAAHDNLLSGNVVDHNPAACGITLASHPQLTGPAPFGVYKNTVSGNNIFSNGTMGLANGAGAGIFASVPGAAAYGNIVINNTLTNNGLPGVTMHGHAPGQTLNDNMIIGNYISGNAGDTGQTATPGDATAGINLFSVSPTSGNLFTQNVITNEVYGIVVTTPGTARANLNSLAGVTTGAENGGAGTLDATENWFGCSGGPGQAGCSGVSGAKLLFNPWLTADVFTPVINLQQAAVSPVKVTTNPAGNVVVSLTVTNKSNVAVNTLSLSKATLAGKTALSIDSPSSFTSLAPGTSAVFTAEFAKGTPLTALSFSGNYGAFQGSVTGAWGVSLRSVSL